MIGNPPPQLLAVAIEAAIHAARMAPCRKSRRGCAVFNPRAAYAPSAVVGSGFNGQPGPWRCDGTCAVAGRCSDLCVHAEDRAMWEAITVVAGYSGGILTTTLRGYDLVHIKVDERGEPVPSGPPSCARCSRLVVDRGIDAVWLLELHPVQVGSVNHGTHIELLWAPDKAPGWTRYPAEQFHQLSIEAARLVGPVEPTVDELDELIREMPDEDHIVTVTAARRVARAMWDLGARPRR